MVRKPDARALVDQFAENVERQTEALGTGNHRTGNKYANRYIAAFKKLRAMGDLGRDALASLLAHGRADVRVTAAAFLLRYRTNDAMLVLQEAAKSTGLIAFEASEAIKRWEEGSWALDPADGPDASSDDDHS